MTVLVVALVVALIYLAAGAARAVWDETRPDPPPLPDRRITHVQPRRRAFDWQRDTNLEDHT